MEGAVAIAQQDLYASRGIGHGNVQRAIVIEVADSHLQSEFRVPTAEATYLGEGTVAVTEIDVVRVIAVVKPNLAVIIEIAEC